MKLEDVKAIFPERLKRLREHAGYSLKELAEALGVSQSLTTHYEKGRQFPKMSNLIKICDLFGTTPNELYGFAPLKDFDSYIPKASD